MKLYEEQEFKDQKVKWENILQSYNRLLQIDYSPMAALNRTYALSMARNKNEALDEALKIDLKQNHLYHLLLAELYKGQNTEKQQEHLQIAAAFAKTQNERKWILEKLAGAKKIN